MFEFPSVIQLSGELVEAEQLVKRLPASCNTEYLLMFGFSSLFGF